MTDTAGAETILEALRARRSVGRVRPEQPPGALVERVIEAAPWAPNHYHTRPWRFVVVAGEARRALGAVMADALRERLEEPDGERAAALLEKERNKPLRAPVLIAVAVVPSPEPRVVETEEICAGAAGVQNMLLAARALGLGATLTTLYLNFEKEVEAALGLPSDVHSYALIPIGYPMGRFGPVRRVPLADVTYGDRWDQSYRDS